MVPRADNDDVADADVVRGGGASFADVCAWYSRRLVRSYGCVGGGVEMLEGVVAFCAVVGVCGAGAGPASDDGWDLDGVVVVSAVCGGIDFEVSEDLDDVLWDAPVVVGGLSYVAFLG